RAEVLQLDGETIIRLALQLLRVDRAAIVRDEDDALQLVHLHQESQLFKSRLAQQLCLFIPRSEARGPSCQSQAIVARDLQVLVTELVKGFSPSSVTAIDRYGSNPFGVPAFHA